MKYILFLLVLVFTTLPLIDAIETESGTIKWKFCDDEKLFDYKIINGTLHDTAHLKLFGTNHCENNTNNTDFQLQLFHTSNNYTDFTITTPDDLEFETIEIHVVGRGYLETFVLNDTNTTIQFSDFTHDKNGLVTIIMDFVGVKN